MELSLQRRAGRSQIAFVSGATEIEPKLLEPAWLGSSYVAPAGGQHSLSQNNVRQERSEPEWLERCILKTLGGNKFQKRFQHTRNIISATCFVRALSAQLRQLRYAY